MSRPSTAEHAVGAYGEPDRWRAAIVWSTVLRQAGFNVSVCTAYIFSQVRVEYDQAQVTLAGWTGLILPLPFTAFFVLIRRLPVRAVAGAPNPEAVPKVTGKPNTRIRLRPSAYDTPR